MRRFKCKTYVGGFRLFQISDKMHSNILFGTPYWSVTNDYNREVLFGETYRDVPDLFCLLINVTPLEETPNAE